MTGEQMPIWGDVLTGIGIERSRKPRVRGLTCVLDKHLGIEGTREMLSVAGQYIDVVKLTSLTSAFYPEALLKEKIRLLRDAGVEVCAGGTCTEVMLWQNVYPAFLVKAAKLGFTGVEVSDGTIDMPDVLRHSAIEQALKAGFRVFSEVGRKEWSPQTGLEDLVADLRRDLASGVDKVIVEAMEVGQGVGIMDAAGRPSEEGLNALVQAAGGPERIIFEAPLRQQQEIFIDRLGSDVNLGNIPPAEVLVVEATRWKTTGIPFMSAYSATLGEA